MCVILEAARRREPPKSLEKFRHRRLNLLANLCAELQKLAGDKPFHLSSRTAGELVGVEPMTAWRYLRRLTGEKVLQIEEKGRPGRKGRATRWRYVANNAIASIMNEDESE